MTDRFLPFPPPLAEWSLKNAELDTLSRFDDGPESSVIVGVASYRDARGRVRVVENISNPWYPEGATPGIGTVHNHWRQFANEAGGYLTTVTDFTPAKELLRDAPLHDPSRSFDPYGELAIAHIILGGKRAFIWAHDEDQLSLWLANAPRGVSIRRGNIMRCGDGDPAAVAIISRPDGASLMMVAPTVRDAFTGLALRAGIDAIGDSDDQTALRRLRVEFTRRGWDIDGQSVGTGPGSLMTRANRNASRLLGASPPALEAARDRNCRMALIEFGGREILLNAFDENSLTTHMANAILDAHGAGRSDHPGRSDQEIVSHYWEGDTEMFIWRGEATFRLAPGSEAGICAMFISHEEAPPLIRGFGAANETALVELVAESLDCAHAGGSMTDLMRHLNGREDMGFHVMAAEDLETRMALIRLDAERTEPAL